MKRIRLAISVVLALSLTPCLKAGPSLDEARKTIDADMAAIRQSGQPATAGDLPKAAIANETNALTDLRAAFKALDTESEAYVAYSQAQIARPLDPAQIQLLQQVASESKPAIERIAKARTKQLSWDIAMTSPLANVKLPDLGQQRQVALVLFACALSAHSEGDESAALDRIDDMLYLARCADEQGILISHLVALAITGRATGAVAFIAPDLQLGKDDAAPKRCAQLIRDLLDESSTSEGLKRALCTERVFLIDNALACADGRLSPAEVRKALEEAANRNGPVQLPDDEGIKATALADTHLMLEHLARMIPAATVDWPTARASLPKAYPNAAEHPWAAVAEPVHERFFTNQYRGIALRRLAATALALRCYALDHQGRLPASLHDLVPTYLPAVPKDPFAPGDSLKYSRDESLISSVGPDGASGKAADKDLTFRLR